MVAAIDIAATPKERTGNGTRIALEVNLDCASTGSVYPSAHCSTALRGEMPQASAACATVEAELFGCTVSDHMAASSGMQHDSDNDYGRMSPASSCGDDSITDEHMEDFREEDIYTQAPTGTQSFGSATVQYTRHQVCDVPEFTYLAQDSQDSQRPRHGVHVESPYAVCGKGMLKVCLTYRAHIIDQL